MPASQVQGVSVPTFQTLEKIINVGAQATVRVEINILNGTMRFTVEGIDLAFSYFTLELRNRDRLLFSKTTPYLYHTWGSHNSVEFPLEQYLEALRAGADTINIRKISDVEAGKR